MFTCGKRDHLELTSVKQYQSDPDENELGSQWNFHKRASCEFLKNTFVTPNSKPARHAVYHHEGPTSKKIDTFIAVLRNTKRST